MYDQLNFLRIVLTSILLFILDIEKLKFTEIHYLEQGKLQKEHQDSQQ